jgi:ferrous iron transport protein A
MAAAIRATDVPLPAAAAVALADLEPGTAARVEAVDPGSAIGRRLLDLGFVPGTEVRVVRRAPLGDPVEYELRGYRLCLRRSEALRIRVQRV